MINYNTLIVWDTETGSVDPSTTDVLQIAAVAINPRSLKVIEGSEFNIYCKPATWDTVQDGALKVNKLSKEFIEEKGFELKTAWKQFTDYLQSFNRKGSKFTAPVACGMNIRNFDMIIFDRLCKQFDSPADLFFKRNCVDILDLAFLWFENSSEPAKYNMDALRDFFGLSRDNAHNAVEDCKQCAQLITRFLQFHRNLGGADKFKGAFKK